MPVNYLVNKRIAVTGGLNVRSAPAIGAGIITALSSNAPVQIFDNLTAAANGYTWQAILLPDNRMGWCVTALANVATLADVGVAVPVPVPVTPPPVAAPSGTKIGLHVMGSLTASQLQHARDRGAAVYKAVDAVTTLQTIHASNQNALYVFRRWAGSDQNPDAYINSHGGPANAANQWIAEHRADIEALPWAYHEAFNEQGASDTYIAFELERTRQMAALGRKTCILNLQTGVSDSALWMRARDAVQMTIDTGSIIGVHGYGQTVMSANFGGSYFDSNGVWTGDLFPTGLSHDAWTALRVIRDGTDLQSMGKGATRIVLTEFGLDDVATNKSAAQGGNGIYYSKFGKTKGWRSCIPVWNALGWLAGTTPEDFYRRQLAWAETILKQVPQFAGACVFTYGTDDATWADFDVRGVL